MRVSLRAALVVTTLAAASSAEAIPAFARKTGMSCSACHLAWPVLNQQGQIFRDNGYQLGLMKDEPGATAPSYVPFSGRATAAYQMARLTNQPSDQGPIETRTGGVPQPAFDLLAGGTFAPDLAYLIVLAGFTAGEPGAVESAWARVSNISGSGWLNLKVGKFEPDQPVSEKRSLSRTGIHSLYAARFAGSAVGFDLSANQVGVELDGHDARSLARYSVAFMSANGDPGSSNLWSAPVVYAHIQKAWERDDTVLPWLRVGLLGAMGWWPTRFATTSAAGGAAVPVPGTGKGHRTYSRVGGDLSGMFGYPTAPFFWTAVVVHGREQASPEGTDPALATVSGRFTGGFLEVNWVPYAEVSAVGTPWVLFGRYELIRYRGGVGDLEGFTVGLRRYLAMGPRASASILAEVRSDWTRKQGADPGKEVAAQTGLIGLDFSF